MPPPSAAVDFLALVRRSGLLDETTLSQFPESQLPDDPQGCAAVFVRARALTPFQAKNLLQGRFRGLVVGPYKLLQPLGQGGMGVVYLAEHAQLRRQVAIKVLPHDKARDQMALERFYREARAAAALDHPNIVRLHDVCQGAGVHFLVMEFVDGTTLQGLLEQTGALHYAQAVDYIAQAAAGLQHAHERGFIHRDIKPANMMVNRQGQVKILDMGLARSFVDPKDQLTSTGMDAETAGTADYIAPEQALNQPTDARADVYSLGVTLFTLVTGKAPFEGTTAQKLLQHQFRQPPEMTKLRATVPPALSEVVAGMMAKQPEERYQSAEEVIDALRPWLPAPAAPTSVAGTRLADGELPLSPKAASKAKSRRVRRAKQLDWLRRNRWPVAAAAGVLVLISGVWALAGGSKKKPTDAAKSGPTPPTFPHIVPATSGSASSSPSPAGVVASLDAAAVSPFQIVMGSEQGVTKPALPAGWSCEVWNRESEGEFRAEPVDGRPALRVAATKGNNAAQFVFRPQESPDRGLAFDRPYQVRIEYQIDPGIEAYVHVQAAGDYKMLGRTVLPNRGPGWHTTTIPIPPGGKPFQVAIGSTRTVQGKFVSLTRVELIAGTATPATTPPAPAAPQAEPPAPAGRSVFTLDLSKVTAFTSTFQDGQHANQEWQSRVPRGVYLFCWKKESVAEFRGVVADGRGAIGVTNLNDERSSQIVFQFDDGFNLSLRPGQQYRLRMEYRTTNEAEGKIFIRNAKNGDFPSIAEGQLSGTGGQWRTIEVPFRRPADGKLDAILDNTTVGEGNALYFRSLEILEVGSQ
jgi:serine/threonine protein kinase